MAYYIITEACICCGTCASVCPMDAIQEGTEAYEITDDCVECGTCVPECPLGNIEMTSQAGVTSQKSKETRNMMVMPESLPNKNKIMDVIHHSETFDVDAFFAGLKSSYIGIDADDYKTFLTQGNEVHTFIGRSDNDNRVISAIDLAIGSEEAKSLIANATAVLMVILRSKESPRPLSMAEMQNISKAFEDFKEETNVVWSVSDDDSLGDFIKVVVLVNIRK